MNVLNLLTLYILAYICHQQSCIPIYVPPYLNIWINKLFNVFRFSGESVSTLISVTKGLAKVVNIYCNQIILKLINVMWTWTLYKFIPKKWTYPIDYYTNKKYNNPIPVVCIHIMVIYLYLFKAIPSIISFLINYSWFQTKKKNYHTNMQ